MIVAIKQIALLVRDYDEAKDFYCRKLGFTVLEDSKITDEKRWVRVKAPGDQGCELLLSKAVDDQQLSCVGKQAGSRVFLFLQTNDFDSDYESFQSKGIEFTEKSRNEKYGKVAVFKDLYGNRIDLIGPVLSSK